MAIYLGEKEIGFSLYKAASVDETSKEYYHKLLSTASLSSKELPNGDYILCSNNSSAQGIYYVYSDTFCLEKIYDKGYSWNNIIAINGNELLIYGSSSGSTQGLLHFNVNTHEVNPIYNTGYGWKILKTLDSGNLLLTQTYSSANVYLALYDINTRELKVLFNKGYNAIIKKTFSNGDLLIYGDRWDSYGVHLFRISDETIFTLIDKRGEFTIPYTFDNGNLVVTSTYNTTSTSYYQGVGIIDVNNYAYYEIYGSGCNWTSISEVKDTNKLYLSSTSMMGILVYDLNTNISELKFSDQTKAITLLTGLPNGNAIGSQGSNVVIIDFENNTLTSVGVTTSATSFKSFNKNGLAVITSAQASSSYKFLMVYNCVTGQFNTYTNSSGGTCLYYPIYLDNGNILLTTLYSPYNTLLYNSSENIFTLLYTRSGSSNDYNYSELDYIKAMNGDIIFYNKTKLGNSSTSNINIYILRYSIETNTVTQLYNWDYSFLYVTDLTNDTYFSTRSSAIIKYNKLTDTFESITTNSSTYLRLDTGCVTLSNGNIVTYGGKAIFNPIDESFKWLPISSMCNYIYETKNGRILFTGTSTFIWVMSLDGTQLLRWTGNSNTTNLNIFTEDDKGVTLSSTSENKLTLYYDFENNTMNYKY